MLTRILLAALLAPLLPNLSLAATLQFEDLGPTIGMNRTIVRVSDDGKRFLGTVDYSTAVRWQVGEDAVVLDPLTSSSTDPVDQSGDGEWATGRAGTVGVRWRPDGTADAMDDLVPGPATSFIQPNAISRDGQTVVGVGGTSQFHHRAFVWTEASGTVNIHPFFGHDYSRALDVSSDGSTVVGCESINFNASFGNGQAFIWTPTSGAIGVTIPGYSFSQATAVSDDGTVVAGFVSEGSSYQIFRWTAATGAVLIGPGPLASLDEEILLSADGSTIYGGAVDKPFYWTATLGFVSLPTADARFTTGSSDGSILYGVRDRVNSVTGIPFRWTSAEGVVDLLEFGGSGSSTVVDTPADGSSAVGMLRYPSGLQRAVKWAPNVTIGVQFCGPAAPHSASPEGGLMALSGTNQRQFAALELRATNLPLQSFGFFIASDRDGFVATPGGSDGNLCLTGSIGRFVGPGQAMSSGASGQFTLTIDPAQIPTPNGPYAPYIGEPYYFQAWFRDANPTPTSNFTDAVMVPVF